MEGSVGDFGRGEELAQTPRSVGTHGLENNGCHPTRAQKSVVLGN